MKRIFLVDGDPSMRDRMRRALEDQELEVSDYHSSVEALAAVLSDPPDLLIADAGRRGMSGLDMAATIRNEAAPDLPIILTAARPSPALTAKARRLGVRFILPKPVDDFAELCSAIRRELHWTEAARSVRHLDELRSEFFIDLSHQLRTPVTAMRLAMDGLFSQLSDVMNPSQKNLAAIGRRNIERLVTLVENQLDLLQMMAGDRRVSRKLVDLVGLVRSMPGTTPEVGVEDDAAATELRTVEGGSAGPIYVFTDPDYLAAVVGCILGSGPPSSKRSVRLDCDQGLKQCVLEVRVEFLPGSADDAETAPGRDPIPALDFEYRAYQTLLKRVGGDLTMERSDDLKWVRICIPRYPAFDRQIDFINPIQRVCGESGVADVRVVKCDLEVEGDDFLAENNPGHRAFLERVTSVISRGEAVLRGERYGSFYLVLAGRGQSELDRVVAYLGGASAPGRRGAGRGHPHVGKPLSVVPDELEVGTLMRDFELV